MSNGNLAILPHFSWLHLISTQNNKSIHICSYLAWDITCPNPGIVQVQVVWDLEQPGVVAGAPSLTGGGTGWVLKFIPTRTILGFYDDTQSTFAKIFMNPTEPGLVSGFVTKAQTKKLSPCHSFF